MIPPAFQEVPFQPAKDGISEPERRHIGAQKAASWKTSSNSLLKNGTLPNIFLNFASNYTNCLQDIYG